MRQHRLNVILLAFLVLLLTALLVWFVWFFVFRTSNSVVPANTSNEVNVENTVSTNNETNNTTTNTVNNTVANTTNTTTNTTEPRKGTSSTSGNITVTTPTASSTLAKTFSVSGYAKVFENVVQVRVTDSKGVILLETFVNTDAPDIGKTGTYKKTLTLTKNPMDKKGKIEFYTSDAATGAEQDNVSVSVKFQ